MDERQESLTDGLIFGITYYANLNTRLTLIAVGTKALEL
jgi:hypothetical protein